jgi:hypothetical protein
VSPTSDTSEVSQSGYALIVRLATAVVQGLVLYWLLAGEGPKSWTPAQQQVLVPLWLIAVWVPYIFYFGVGQMRAVPLVLWAAAATLILAGIGYHSTTRGGYVAPYSSLPWSLMPLWIVLGIAAFIAHVLVVDTVAERRLVPGYERHFDTAWKLGLQLWLAGLFVSIFWLVLYLGGALFTLLKLSFFAEFIKKPLFIWLATALATAVAIHVTDTQPSLVRGFRSVVLSLFSWLLPLFAVIVLGFLLALLFGSLDNLWKTRFAASLLLWSAVVLIFLINAAFLYAQNSRARGYSLSLASLELVPLVGLAAWAIKLRVVQYGWSTDRIFATAVATIVFFYAAGYVLALVSGSAWQKRFEAANVVAAYAILAVILALFSPLADPGRLMVADQVARLKSGIIDATSFDYGALRRDGARWGKAALEQLSETKEFADSARVNASARSALTNPGLARTAPSNYVPAPVINTVKLTPELVEVVPAGRTLPESFFSEDHGAFRAKNPACAQPNSKQKCRAAFVVSNDGHPEAILFSDNWTTQLYEQGADGGWEHTGLVQGRTYCSGVKSAMSAGTFGVAAHPWPDLVIGGERLTIVPVQKGGC